MSAQSSGMWYQDFALQVVPRPGRRFRVYAQCQQGEGKGPFTVPPEWRAPGAPFGPRPRGGPARDMTSEPPWTPKASEDTGARLFDALFPPEVRGLYESSLAKAQGRGTGLRIKLMLDPTDPELTGLLDLPWEDLRRPPLPDFLALRTDHSIVRYLMVPRPVEAAERPAKLRILTLAASPRGLLPLDLEREKQNLAAALEPAAGAVEIEEVTPPTLDALRQALRAGEHHGLHFMGHGSFGKDGGGGVVYFERTDRGMDPVRGEDLANTLAGFPRLRLVVLNACQTARTSEGSGNGTAHRFEGVASALVMGGLPAVVAMRSPISDAAAIAFSRSFYQRLAGGDTVDTAMVEGRQAIHSAAKERAEWATPALFMRTREGDLFPSEDLPPEKYPARPWWPGWVAAALLLLLLGGVSWLLCFERFVREGSRLLQEGQPEEARAELSKALALAPYSADAHLGMAMAEQRSGDRIAAEKHYARAVELKPHDPKYRYHLGAYLDDHRRYVEAARELTRAIADDKTYVPAYNELALNEIEQGLWGAARDTLNEGLKYAAAGPESPAQLYDKLGQVDLHEGKIEDAIAHLGKALDFPQERDREANTLAFLIEAYAQKSDAPGVCGTIEKFQVFDPQGITEKAPNVHRLGEQYGCPRHFDS